MTAATNTARTGIKYRASVNEDELKRLHRSGLSANEIGAILGVTGRTIVRHRVRLGIAQPAPNMTPVSSEWLATAQRVLDDGGSQAETARTVGGHPSTVGRYFPGRGWDRQTAGEHANAVRRANREFAKQGLKPLTADTK